MCSDVLAGLSSPQALTVPVSFPASAQAELMNEYMMCLFILPSLYHLLTSAAQRLDLAWSRGAFTTDYGIRMVLGLNPKPLDSLPVPFRLERTEE